MKPKLLAILPVLILLAGPALCQWQENGVAVCTNSGDQYETTISSDCNGGVITAWMDERNGFLNPDIYCQRMNHLGVAQWTIGGVPICTETGYQRTPAIIGQNDGGAIVTWFDSRSGNNDIYTQRINGAGAVQWTIGGVAVCTQTSNQQNPIIVSDGGDGAIITWNDGRNGLQDVYTQRVNNAGTVQWTANGVPICTAANNQWSPVMISDGVGGAIIAWSDYRGGNYDIYAQRISSSGTVQWTADGVPICTALNTQQNTTIISDNAGGAIIAWDDNRNGNCDIYAQRINSAGVVQWTADGIAVSVVTGTQSNTKIASDGAGGALITWQDNRGGNYDIFAQRVNGAGIAQWTNNGVAVSADANVQQNPTIASDGAGGAVIAWDDYRSGNPDIYAQRINGAGEAQWAANGMAVCAATNQQNLPSIFVDGGGAVITWQYDYRSGASYDVFAQKIDRLYGDWWGRNKPAMAGVADVPKDQGGRVTVKWNASFRDAYPDTLIDYYSVWRSMVNAKASGQTGATLTEPSCLSKDFSGPGYFVEEKDGKTYYWEWLANIPRVYEPSYGYCAETFADSVSGARNYRFFKVITHTIAQPIFWSSNPDSGYSVDNLPPAKVLDLTGKVDGMDVHLTWAGNTESDLWQYVVNRYSDIVPPGKGEGKAVIDYTTDTSYVDTDTEPGVDYSYRIAAMDIHGNVGPLSEWLFIGSLSVSLSMFSSMELEDGRVSVRWRTESEENCLRWDVERSNDPNSTYETLGSVPGQGSTTQPTDYRYDDESELAPGKYYYRLCQMDLDGGKRYFGPVSLDYKWRVPAGAGIAGVRPNPFSQITTINYQITQSGPVSLKVYNVYGQLVRSLGSGQRPAGYHRARWDGRNDRGRSVSAGVYVVRLEGEGFSGSVRVAVVR